MTIDKDVILEIFNQTFKNLEFAGETNTKDYKKIFNLLCKFFDVANSLGKFYNKRTKEIKGNPNEN